MLPPFDIPFQLCSEIRNVILFSLPLSSLCCPFCPPHNPPLPVVNTLGRLSMLFRFMSGVDMTTKVWFLTKKKKKRKKMKNKQEKKRNKNGWWISACLFFLLLGKKCVCSPGWQTREALGRTEGPFSKWLKGVEMDLLSRVGWDGTGRDGTGFWEILLWR